VIGTDKFVVTENVNDGTKTVSGLYVTDADATGSATFTMSAVTGAGPASSVTPASGSGLDFEDINTALEIGITYNPGNCPPQTDVVMLSVTDSLGGTDTVNFIFNQAETGPNVALNGTSGKDVIFATEGNDTLTGGAGADQFVFAPESECDPSADEITDFKQGEDHIDLRAFAQFVNAENITGWLADPEHVTTSCGDKLITLDTGDTITLKGLAAASLLASDFIVSPH
jgi:hypothetical protein